VLASDIDAAPRLVIFYHAKRFVHDTVLDVRPLRSETDEPSAAVYSIALNLTDKFSRSFLVTENSDLFGAYTLS